MLIAKSSGRELLDTTFFACCLISSGLTCYHYKLEFGSVRQCSCGKQRKTGEPGEKPSELSENQQQIQTTCDARIQTQSTALW